MIQKKSKGMSGNKGEWSELYTFMKLLGQGRVYAANEKVEKIEEDINKTETLQNRFEQIINRVQRQDVSNVFVWGTPENRAEIKDILSKLVLCIEMGSYEKAEMFSEKIKKLCEGAGMDYMKQIFKLQLAVRNSDYDRSMQEYNGFLNIFEKD